MTAPDWRAELAPPDSPPPPPAWPPAPAAVGLLVLAVLLIGSLIRLLWLRRRRERWRRQALHEWRQMAAQPDVVALSRLLRRVARLRSGAATAALADAAFADYLQQSSQNTLSAEMAQWLAACAHRPAEPVRAEHLTAVRRWIQQC